MFLVVTATAQEMEPIARQLAARPGWYPLVTGIGSLETAVRLSRHLAATSAPIRGIVNAGVAGAFVGAGPGLLDLCLAESETLAEVGIAMADGIVDFDTIQVPTHFALDDGLRRRGQQILAHHGWPTFSGPFVTVQAVSGTEARGERLRRRCQAICETMEGAAVVRVAQEFAVPCLEIRAVSNMVVDRDLGGWQLSAAMARCGEALGLLLPALMEGEA